MSTQKTMDQEWKDNFNHLPPMPFQLLLAHAASTRHLDEMLTGWLGRYWQLSKADGRLLRDHWQKWFSEHADAKARKRDHLVRTIVDQHTRDEPNALSNHYLHEFEAGLGKLDGGLHTRLNPHYPEWSYTVGAIYRVQTLGGELEADLQLHCLPGNGEELVWWAVIRVEDATERELHLLNKSAHGWKVLYASTIHLSRGHAEPLKALFGEAALARQLSGEVFSLCTERCYERPQKILQSPLLSRYVGSDSYQAESWASGRKVQDQEAFEAEVAKQLTALGWQIVL